MMEWLCRQADPKLDRLCRANLRITYSYAVWQGEEFVWLIC